MRRLLHHVLYVCYGALFGWLAWCAVQSARNGAPWVCAVFVAGSGLVVVAATREGALKDALRREAVRAQRARRLHPADAGAAEAAVALAGWCCDAWAATAGGEHGPSCRYRLPKGNGT
ncbi:MULTISPECIES: hypothetical protein [Streptomyces]|uniref:hypothetical protein n=1 Tax=Streptomyces TaxID=1883 RepID=UPI00081B1088|nr:MULTISPECIES: hypothetical protein [unclassified Streptomyces]MYQ50027.1 hypothetical protein [Streptomyces sp. SID4941]SCD31994.1 hypothetical protein GA0115247_102468 [Streptomyces sp. PalvLS-984]SDC87952.1 hypothetical protein F558DRAFT_02766 [Streptomyces sp. AmelKG-A3]